MKLLRKAEFHLAADFISSHILKEEESTSNHHNSSGGAPSDGPAARVDISILPDEINGVSNLATPNTSALNYAVRQVPSIENKVNKDYFEKVGRSEKNVQLSAGILDNQPLPNVISRTENESTIPTLFSYTSESSSSVQNMPFNTSDNLANPACSRLLANPCIQQKRDGYTNQTADSSNEVGTQRTISTLDGMRNDSNRNRLNDSLGIPFLNTESVNSADTPYVAPSQQLIPDGNYLPDINNLLINSSKSELQSSASNLNSTSDSDIIGLPHISALNGPVIPSTISNSTSQNFQANYNSEFPMISALNLNPQDNSANLPNISALQINSTEQSGEPLIPDLSGLRRPPSRTLDQN